MTKEILDDIREIGGKVDQYKSQVKTLQDTVDALEAEKIKGSGVAIPQADALLQKSIDDNRDNFAKLERGERGATANIQLKAVGTITTANVTGGTAYGNVVQQGIIPGAYNRSHMRAILPVQSSAHGNDFVFMKDNGGEGAPAPHVEGTTKSQFDVDLVEGSVKFETIAGWASISRKALNNISGLNQFIQNVAVQKLLDVEDNQILYGDGTTPNLKGILTSGNFTASTSAAVSIPDRIIDDLSSMGAAYRIPAAILLKDAQYWSLFKNKASGSGEYDLPQGITFSGGQLYMWGIPTYIMPVLATNAGSPTSNDYAILAKDATALQVSEGIMIEFFYEDGDNARKNLVTVRVEETVALPVFHPGSIKGNI